MTVWFDMDGTLCDFYGVRGWLDDLLSENPRPYSIARPRLNFSALARQIHRLQNSGIDVGIISWLSKDSTPDYDRAVTTAKLNWLQKHLPSVDFDSIYIVEYGTPKQKFAETDSDILFDDEWFNRANWNGIAYNVDDILEILRTVG